jgi:hypothetical protein
LIDRIVAIGVQHRPRLPAQVALQELASRHAAAVQRLRRKLKAARAEAAAAVDEVTELRFRLLQAGSGGTGALDDTGGATGRVLLSLPPGLAGPSEGDSLALVGGAANNLGGVGTTTTVVVTSPPGSPVRLYHHYVGGSPLGISESGGSPLLPQQQQQTSLHVRGVLDPALLSSMAALRERQEAYLRAMGVVGTAAGPGLNAAAGSSNPNPTIATVSGG